jgi:hypothetical protein
VPRDIILSPEVWATLVQVNNFVNKTIKPLSDLEHVGDPVGSGLVTSLARPGGNVTGLSNIGPDLVAKCLELLKQAVPGVDRVAVLWVRGALGERRIRTC